MAISLYVGGKEIDVEDKDFAQKVKQNSKKGTSEMSDNEKLLAGKAIEFEILNKELVELYQKQECIKESAKECRQEIDDLLKRVMQVGLDITDIQNGNYQKPLI